ncbi:unnamed protein product [Rhodiola kirilowii]
MLRSSSSASVSPFTVSQWQELEHQALIYKYLMAGLAIPPDLVLPIQKSFEAVSSRFFTHPTMGYCSFYGKKYDPEPGRCRRTDGKKWRCSKDAYPDSKYCERHMHRGRNRSRKPVESPQTAAQLAAASSTVTSLNVGSNGGAANTTGFPTLPLQVFGGSLQSSGVSSGINQSHFNEDHIPYGIPSKDYRYAHGLKPETGEHNFFSDTSGNNRNLQIENAWSMLPSQVSSFPSPKPSNNNSLLQNDYTQTPLFSPDFTSGSDASKQGNSSLRPFFDEWPKARDSWSGLEEERSNQGSYSTTHLSMSIPMGSFDFSATSSQSPNGTLQHIHTT